MSKHTKGPWEFVDNSLVGPKFDNKPVWLRPVILRSETGITKADAQLISAAPDLLEALEALIEDQRDASLPVLAQARAAIAKARSRVDVE